MLPGRYSFSYLDWLIIGIFGSVNRLWFLFPADGGTARALRSTGIPGVDASPIGKRILGYDFYLNWNGWSWERTINRYALLATERGKKPWLTEAQAERGSHVAWSRPSELPAPAGARSSSRYRLTLALDRFRSHLL